MFWRPHTRLGIKHGRIHNNSLSVMNFFLGSKGSSKIMISTRFSICRYFFQRRIFNLTKTKKADLKKILSPIIVGYYEKNKATTYVAAAMYVLEEDTIKFVYVIECGMGDDAEGLSYKDV